MKIKITALAESRELFSKTYDETNSTMEELMFLADSSSSELFYFLLKEMNVELLNGYRDITFDKKITFDEPIKTVSYKINLEDK